ncbi:MAG TPA: hypothetical protein VJO33_12030 [Gemmatimonadaceae bacterium]|nr:hypothetical protein [Gemmatimonadaceae bacterium]
MLDLSPPRHPAPPRVRWREFRLVVLQSCRSRPRTTSDLVDLFELPVTLNNRRAALRHLNALIDGGFLQRAGEGYLTTVRGRRVAEDVEVVERAEAENRDDMERAE